MAIAIALVIKTFVVQPFFIPSSSMENTLLIGDKVLVNKIIYHFRSIQPGDIIVFNGVGSWDAAPAPTKPPSNPFVRAYDATLRPLFHSIAGLVGTPVGQTDYIKRVIGVPGDHVVCNNACARHGGLRSMACRCANPPTLYPGAEPSTIPFNIVVPAGRLWVMGDNRGVSDDSRLRQSDPGHGTIPESAVIGRAFVIVWPPSHWRILPIPSTFNQPGINKPAAAGAVPAQPGSRRRAAGRAYQGAPVGPLPAIGGGPGWRRSADLAAAAGQDPPGRAPQEARSRARPQAGGPRSAASVTVVHAERPRAVGYTPRRSNGLSAYERVLARAGLSPIAGVDEAGRGACAGPLVVAAVMLRPSRLAKLTELADSKMLTAKARNVAYKQVMDAALDWSVITIPARRHRPAGPARL